MIEAAIQQVKQGQNLSMEQAAEAMGAIVEGRCQEAEIARLLGALHNKGESVDEVAGAAAALRRNMTPIRNRHAVLLDTCGTGGDGSAPSTSARPPRWSRPRPAWQWPSTAIEQSPAAAVRPTCWPPWA